MKTTNFFPAILTAFTFVALVSCGKDGDTTKPVIDLREPEEEELFELGSTLHLDMDLSDNEALDEYKVEIHLAAGHTHTRAEEELSIFQETWDDAAGLKNKYVHHDIRIPADVAPGDYHLMVHCTDASGNEAHVVRTIELSTEGGDHDHEDEHDH